MSARDMKTKLHCTLLTNTQNTGQLNAQKAKIDLETKNIKLLGNVIGKYDDFTFSGSNVDYNFKEHSIETSNLTQYELPNFALTAPQTKILLYEKRMILSGGITSSFTITKS